MNNQSKVDLIIKVIVPIITVAGILIGIWQFNTGQERLQKEELIQRQFELPPIKK